MKNLSVVKQYILALIIQIIIITIFIITTIFLTGFEAFVLKPLPCIAFIGAGLIVMDFIILLFVYRKNNSNFDSEVL